ncbi:MAG: FtsX-like permease family protein [Varibaculum cambriense]|uniref:ABC transporter permease n=1 Tax=Varibaculum cambriense TaxID=184870 RepID=UPI0029130EE3|nr:FtsX-like permease family protein [Varibaculum cambriense]MDU4944018.1 FtsX-like permease family protein [Varibaculum cambriense]
MIRIAWRNLRAHLRRFQMSLLAVVLGVAFLSGIFALRATLADSYDSLIASTNTYQYYLVGKMQGEKEEGQTPVRDSLDLKTAQEAEKVTGVRYADPYLVDVCMLADQDNKRLGQAGQVSVLQVLYPGHSPQPRLVKGQAPRGEKEVALEESAAKRLGITTGKKLKIYVSSEGKTATVSGIYRFPNPVAFTNYVFVDADGFVPLTQKPPPLATTAIGITAEKGVSSQKLRALLNNEFSDTAEVMSQAEYNDEINAAANSSLDFVNVFLLVFAAIALFVGTFIITNTFQMMVRAEQSQFAMLRAIGASGGQVFSIVALQGLLVGILGSAIGVGAGYLLTRLVSWGLAKAGFEALQISWSWSITLLALTVGIIVTVIGSLWPARSAALTPPVEAMRQNTQTQKPVWPRAIIGTLVLALAGGLLAWASSDSGKNGLWLGIGAALFLLAMLILVTPLSAAIIRVLAGLIWWLRPHARLAMRTLTANLRQTANTAAALMIGVALVAVGATLAASTKASTQSVIDQKINTDLVVSTEPTVVSLSPSLLNKAARVSGVKQVDLMTGIGLFRITVPGKKPEQTMMQVTYPQFDRYIKVTPISGATADYFSQSPATPRAIVSRAWAKSRGLAPGDKIEISGIHGQEIVTIAATIDTELIFLDVMVPRSLATKLGPEAADITTSASIELEDGADLNKVQREVQKVVSNNPFMVVQTHQEAADRVAATVDQVLSVLYALLALSLIIAALGIMNTLSLSVQQRFRELGLIRTVGLSSLGLSLMITVESVLITLAGTLLGIGGGTALATFVCRYLSDRGISSIEVPWASLGLICLLAVLVGTLAALMPARRARRMPILEAVSSGD